MESGIPFTTGPLVSPPLAYRERREAMILSECDDRSAIEKLIDFMTAARIAYYHPSAPPAERGDIICLCCGHLYRPDDVMDGENIFLCGSCILLRKERQE